MRKATRRVTSLLALCSAWSGSALADTYFFDDFESQPVNPVGTKIQDPPIGLSYYYNAATQVEAVNIVTPPKPVIGTQSLETYRLPSAGADIGAISLDNALVSGKVLELQWSHALANGTGTDGNAPMQNSIGFGNGLIGQLAWVTINDTPGHSGEYHYADAFGNYQTPTGLKPTLGGGFDRLRMVMSLQDYDATYLTGTFDLFISLNGAPEVQVANDVSLLYAQKTTPEDIHFGGLTSLMFRMQKGPFTSNSYYDNISLRDFVAVPSPTAWNVDASGNWSLGTNWNPTNAPNGIGATANFGTVITSTRTVTVDAAQTVGTINFDSSFAYTIAGSNTLTIDASGPGGISVSSGSHVISAPVVLNADLIVNSGTNSGVALTGNLTAAGRIVSKSGAGTAQFENVRALTLNVNGGTAKISSKGTANSATGTSVVTSLNIAAGAALDLTNNSMIVDYTGPVGTQVGDTRDHLKNGRLTTSAGTTTTRLGYGDNAVLGKSTFAGQTPDSSSILIKYTYAGDADLDGDADGVDIGTWATNFTGELGGAGSQVWTQGDWDYDGDVDGVDAGLWAQAFTGELGGGGLGSLVVYDPHITPGAAAILRGMGITVVPEPATMLVAGALAAWLLTRRSGHRVLRANWGPT